MQQSMIKILVNLTKMTQMKYLSNPSFIFMLFKIAMIRINSGKCLNQLAYTHNSQEEEQRVREDISINRFKMKSINQFAKTDLTFIPSLNDKSLVSSTINTCTINSNMHNPQVQGFQIVKAKSMDLEKVPQNISIKIGDQKGKDAEYCTDCDQNYFKPEAHSCKVWEASLQAINDKIKQLSALIDRSKCDKFAIFAETAYHFTLSDQLISLVSLLKCTTIKYTPFEISIRKRLINLCSKKIGFLLEKQDYE